jgi:hypothetical protein
MMTPWLSCSMRPSKLFSSIVGLSVQCQRHQLSKRAANEMVAKAASFGAPEAVWARVGADVCGPRVRMR